MKIHYLQHVPFEDLANIRVWAETKGYGISRTLLYETAKFPSQSDFDWLVIMGGPMGIYEEEKYSWLKAEKQFIKETIESGKKVLGICLGSQLIAEAIGGKVFKQKHKEIGWFDVSLVDDAKNSRIFTNFPNKFLAFHWHGDNFDLPKDALRIAESEACKNQAFEYNDGKVVGIQFHLDYSYASLEQMIENCGDELVDGKYIQQPKEILNGERVGVIYEYLTSLLENLNTI